MPSWLAKISLLFFLGCGSFSLLRPPEPIYVLKFAKCINLMTFSIIQPQPLEVCVCRQEFQIFFTIL